MDVMKDKKYRNIDGIVHLQNHKQWTAEVSLRGGIVTSWKNGNHEELLFYKNTSNRRKQIKGGISICFPMYSIHYNIQNVARDEIWIINKSHCCQSESCVELLFKPNSLILTPCLKSYELRLHVELEADGKLKMSTRVENTHPCKDFSFTFAYHNYFALYDIRCARTDGLSIFFYFEKPLSRDVQIEGLSMLHSLNNPNSGKLLFVEHTNIDFYRWDLQLDRGYLNAPDKVVLTDEAERRTFVIEKSGDTLPDIVLWNPGKERNIGICDLGEEDQLKMVCMGAANIKKSINLKPSETWTGVQEISVVIDDFPEMKKCYPDVSNYKDFELYNDLLIYKLQDKEKNKPIV